jgi:hypothetical protein
VTAGQFLGIMIHERGIEFGDKSKHGIKTIQPPTNKKELQSLIGKFNYIRRFIPDLSGWIEAFMPLVKTQKKEEFVWGLEQQKAFDSLKEYLTTPLVLVPPQTDRPFIVYLSIDVISIGSVVIQEYEGQSESCSISVDDYLMLKPGTPRWSSSASAYILHAQSFATTSSMPRSASFAKPILSSICYQRLSSKVGSTSGCTPYQNMI